MKIAMVQMCSGPDVGANLTAVDRWVRQAADQGARVVLTPEVTNCISLSRAHQSQVLRAEADDPTLAHLQALAAELGVWVAIGSLALRGDGDRFVNRSFLLDPSGGIVARYDKIHMFDVTLSDTERYHESAAYAPGERAVVVDGFAPVGLSVCYDLRFPHLYRAMAQAGAKVLLVPSAFARVTGAAHWHTLLRARAIECGAFVLAAAQVGVHDRRGDRSRASYGHSLAVGPWGEVLADGGSDDQGVVTVDLDLSQVADARRRVPSLSHDRPFERP